MTSTSRRSHRPPSRAGRPASLRVRGVALLLLAATGAACAAAPLEEWTLDLEEVLTLGAEPVTPETAFFRPGELGFDGAGNVYVLDSGNHRVQVFDPEGSYLRTFGEPGVGPGQLVDAQGMFVLPDGRVWIADTRNRRLQPYSGVGEALPPVTVDLFPLDLVVAGEKIFVQRMPQTSLLYGADPAPLIAVLDHSGNVMGGFVDAVPTTVGILYMLENMLSLAPAPAGGVAVSNTHFDSLLRVYDDDGALNNEIPVLYKAGAWAPLGRRPAEINDASLERIARTSTDLAWDPRRRMFWVLAGHVDQTPEGAWITGREAYRYSADGTYRGSVMLAERAVSIAAGPDGRLWTIDIEGVVHAFRVTDPDMAPPAASDDG